MKKKILFAAILGSVFLNTAIAQDVGQQPPSATPSASDLCADDRGEESAPAAAGPEEADKTQGAETH